MSEIVNEHEVVIPAGQSVATDINLGLEYSGISHIVLLGDEFTNKHLKIYQWSRLAQSYFPIYSIKEKLDVVMECTPNKCIFFNQFILTGNKFKFALDLPVMTDAKIVLFKVKK